MKRNKYLYSCELIIKIHVTHTVLHTSEDTVELLTGSQAQEKMGVTESLQRYNERKRNELEKV